MSERASDGAGSATTATNAHVLVIDDSLVCRTAMRRILERASYRVSEAACGEDALQMLAEDRPDIVLCDVQMPGLSGFDVCRRIHAIPELQDLPLLFVTAEDDADSRLRGFQAGASDYIAKGASDAEVDARVRAHVRISQMQSALRRSHDAMREQLHEIQRQTREREILTEQVQTQQVQLMQNEKLASVGQLAAGVAHEINNPIAFIASNLNTLGEYVTGIIDVIEAARALGASVGTSPEAAAATEAFETRCSDADIDFVLEDLRGIVEESISGTERVRKIVSDLRDFSHVDSPDLAPADLNGLVEKTLSVALNEIKYKADVDLQFGEIPEIPCYGGKLGQVILNLLVNAAQAIESRGTITVATGCANEHVWLTVHDTGCGMTADQIARAFDPFFTTKPVGTGTGLGLHLSAKIVAAHGGEMQIESEPGAGTTFRVELPVAGPPDADAEVERAA